MRLPPRRRVRVRVRVRVNQNGKGKEGAKAGLLLRSN